MRKYTILSICFLAFVIAISCSKQEERAETSGSVSSKLKAGSAYSLNNWMGAVDGLLKISQLSIPGTHDAGARYESISGTAKCQNLTIGEQLAAGIRFLDIRCRHIENAFAIHHGSVYQNMNFDDVLNACWTFLSANPSECIVMSVKEEYNSSNISRTFEQTFDAYVQKNSQGWYLGASIPALNTVRGKIVLLRRFGAASAPKGIDATNWADNTVFTITNASAQLKVQDIYKVSDNNVKWNNITALFNESKSGDMDVLYMNFTSGYKPLIFGIPSITSVSNFMNSQLNSYFTTNSSGRFGIIPMDFADSNRSSLIVGTNF